MASRAGHAAEPTPAFALLSIIRTALPGGAAPVAAAAACSSSASYATISGAAPLPRSCHALPRIESDRRQPRFVGAAAAARSSLRSDFVGQHAHLQRRASHSTPAAARGLQIRAEASSGEAAAPEACTLVPSSSRMNEFPSAESSAPKGKVVVGMSGGVDSSAVAGILLKEGYEVVGVTLWHMKGEGSCCSGGMFDAGRVCDQLGVEHYVVDTRDEFEQNVINYVVSGFEAGITPLPCSQCNKTVKFRGLMDFADEAGIDKVATGHYARVERDEGTGRYKLRRAADRTKDQTYFLYDLGQEQLRRVIFPLAETTKVVTREKASDMGLATAKKPESQDLCLAEAHGSMRAFLDKYIAEKPGEIVDQDGKVLGTHYGIHHFTVGQRKGLGVAADRPLYVVGVDAEKNQVVVCKEKSTALLPEATISRANWVSVAPITGPLRAEVQLRYRSPPVPCTVYPVPERPDAARIVFDDPQFGVAPGQAAVFYDGEYVLGGGILDRYPLAARRPAGAAADQAAA
eukprot:tig00000269_g23688.t1